MSPQRTRVAVVGATGYTGSEVIRLLSVHPYVQVVAATSERSAGGRLEDSCPWLASDLVLEPFNPGALEADITFFCQENGFAMQYAPSLCERTRVIDLSADFRLNDADTYRQFYGREHVCFETKGVYGLPELTGHENIAKARLLSNPGCYPTATLLGLMPLVRAGLVTGTPVVDAKSGVSGAGRSRKETDYLFTEIDGGFKAYGVTGHRHTPEIEQMVGRSVRFTPHLIPAARGIHATIHVPISSSADLGKLYREFYAGQPFVAISDTPPSTKQVTGSNRCILHPVYDDRTGYAVVVSVIDNLVKGAAGQAIQNMNIMLGLPQETALPLNGVWP